MPFAKWTKEQVCNWLVEQGLGSYLSSGKHWIASGQTLLQASQQDLEKVIASLFGLRSDPKRKHVEGGVVFRSRKWCGWSQYILLQKCGFPAAAFSSYLLNLEEEAGLDASSWDA